MPIPVLETCRKRKRRPKFFNFQTFLEPGCPISPTGPFRDNVRVFLEECAEQEDYTVEGMPIWCSLLVLEGEKAVVPLYTIEENVRKSTKPFCDHCRCTGWGKNLVSKRRYHIIIPVDGQWNQQLDDGVFDLQSHLLHGLIHCNGFGHLLCINGKEGGSKYLHGREIMDLWDRICSNLRARKITVEDLSKKRSMDLRLLYGVAYGHPWFGRWGYRFCRGSFGVSELIYCRAIEILCSLELENIIQDFNDTDRCEEMKQMIQYYRRLSKTQLITLKDLLRFILDVKSCPCTQKNQTTVPSSSSAVPKVSIIAVSRRKPLEKEKSSKYRRFSSVVGHDSRWPVKRLEYAAEVVVNALKGKKLDKCSEGWMTRQDVRDAARMHIGDTGLLDYVLKSMNNVTVGIHVVRRAMNPKTRILEYCVDELGDGVKPLPPVPEPKVILEPGRDVYTDLSYLYMNALLNYPGSELVRLAAQALLDSKHFVKEWPLRDEKELVLRFICQAIANFDDLDSEMNWKSAPGEIIILPSDATMVDLMQAAESGLRDTYCILEEFVVTEIDKLEHLEDRDFLFGAVESGAELFVWGNGMDLHSQLRYEGGPENWKVVCECGARDDDGERMVACDVCEVWQHTRCNGIDDSDAVPPLFVCLGCCNALGSSKSKPHSEFEGSGDLLMIPAAECGMESFPQGMVLRCH
ncbi:hypothetical protein Tsubulata_010374 [Turnera subulata]|uniref:Zinc finger PHD-type domain-containing protein n=1 Tax=Turnera subulata TaxID=218843 RepID=A0A9Q0G203_9ROSI|nr:hypothetical protein Tsubulata_010374 [Turnera subulata]